jgi:hypothetical protein
MAMTISLWPGAKVTLPEGRVPPKSAAFVGLAPLPLTCQSTVALPDRSPTRVMAKSWGWSTAEPSLRTASRATMEMAWSSGSITARAVPTSIWVLALSGLRVKAKVSKPSRVLSPDRS